MAESGNSPTEPGQKPDRADLAAHFGQGLADLVSPLTTSYDDAMKQLHTAQQGLLDRLKVLQASLETTKTAEFPDEKLFRVQERVDALRRRIASINSALSAINDRALRLHATVAARHSAALAAVSQGI